MVVGKKFQNLMYELPFLRGHWESISEKSLLWIAPEIYTISFDSQNSSAR